MSHIGATADLLEVARKTLLDDVAPGLGPERRHAGALVANALAIAIRELELGPATRATERRLLGQFYALPEATLPELQARLCRDLRERRLPEARAAELRTLLREIVHARLSISNPGYAGSDRLTDDA